MDDHNALRIVIRRKLVHGELPHDSIPRFWGGPSRGEACDACEERIDSTELVMEGISTLTNQGIQLHVECFYIRPRRMSNARTPGLA
jgi:hypothetical protein